MGASRRWIIVVGTAVVSASLLAGSGRGAPPLQDGTPAAGRVGIAAAPAWMFVVHLVRDPYPGVIFFTSEELSPGTRVVAAEVEVVNASDQPLSFELSQVRLRDDAGESHEGGGVVGVEAELRAGIVEGGDRSWGWVWFAVPAQARPIELVLIPQAPEFRVRLPETGTPAATASPIATDNMIPAAPSPTSTPHPTSSPTPTATAPPSPTATATPSGDEPGGPPGDGTGGPDYEVSSPPVGITTYLRGTGRPSVADPSGSA